MPQTNFSSSIPPITVLQGNSTNTFVVTSTQTVEKTTTSQASFLFGLPPWELAIFGVVIGLVVLVYFRSSVRSIPVGVLWVYKNRAAIKLKAKEDLSGVFLDVTNARGKTLTTLKKTGLPIEVKAVNKAKAYFIAETRPTDGFNLAEQEVLKEKGWKIEPREAGSWRKRPWNAKQPLRGYLLEKDEETVNETAWLDVSLGGLKHERLYASVEGTGQTIDWLDPAKVDGKGEEKSAILNEEKSAAQEWLRLLAEAAAGGLRSILLPLIAGLGIGCTVTFLVIILTGGKP